MDFKYTIEPAGTAVRVTFDGQLPPELARQIANHAVDMGAAATDTDAQKFYLDVAQQLVDACQKIGA